MTIALGLAPLTSLNADHERSALGSAVEGEEVRSHVPGDDGLDVLATRFA
jgi:hypothetical protein